MRYVKRVSEFAYRETMKRGLKRMEDKTLPNMSMFPFKNDPVESVNSWIFDEKRQDWAAKISRGKSGVQFVSVKDLVELSDQGVLVKTITTLLLDNKRLKAEQQNE